jgi:hypothetical protein
VAVLGDDDAAVQTLMKEEYRDASAKPSVIAWHEFGIEGW